MITAVPNVRIFSCNDVNSNTICSIMPNYFEFYFVNRCALRKNDSYQYFCGSDCKCVTLFLPRFYFIVHNLMIHDNLYLDFVREKKRLCLKDKFHLKDIFRVYFFSPICRTAGMTLFTTRTTIVLFE